MPILVAAVGSCDSDVPKELLHTVFTHPLLGAEAPLQTTYPGYGCPRRAPNPILAGSQPFSSTPSCFPSSFPHVSGVRDADAPTLSHALRDAPLLLPAAGGQ